MKRQYHPGEQPHLVPSRLLQPEPKGFSLAELLVAMALLALVAAFAIPKVVNSNSDQNLTANLRQSVALMDGQLTRLMGEGVTPTTDLTAEFQNRVKTIQFCSANSTTEGCWDTTEQGTPSADTAHAIGFILPSGAAVVGLGDATGDGTPDTNERITFLIDGNGVRGPNALGEDQLHLSFSFQPGALDPSLFPAGYIGPQRGGTLFPLDTDSLALFSTLYD